MYQIIADQIKESIQVKQNLLQDTDLMQSIVALCEQVVEVYRHGNKLLLAGNGGSAADAQHIAAELVGRYSFERPGLSAIALTTDTSILTAVGNDYGFDAVYGRQIEALGQTGDLFIGITTSGNSRNILKALESARKKGLLTAGLTGAGGDRMAPLCDQLIRIPSRITPRIQEAHIMLGHILCLMVEKKLFGEKA